MPASCGLAGKAVKVAVAGACTETLRYWLSASSMLATWAPPENQVDGGFWVSWAASVPEGERRYVVGPTLQ